MFRWNGVYLENAADRYASKSSPLESWLISSRAIITIFSSTNGCAWVLSNRFLHTVNVAHNFRVVFAWVGGKES